MTKKILVIDDDPALAKIMRIGLRAHGYLVTTTMRGLDGLELIAQDPPDIAVVDLGLPDIYGSDLVVEARKFFRGAIVILSAFGDENSKVRSLNSGADDYVTKPFGMREFEARLRALNRRLEVGSLHVNRIISSGDLELNLSRHTVLVAQSQEIRLTVKEFDLLWYLIENEGRICTHQLILNTIWGQGYEESHYVRVYINRLRSKLGTEGDHIVNIPGVGYFWNPNI